MKYRLILIPVLLSFLGACSSTGSQSNIAEPIRKTRFNCPPLSKYTAEEAKSMGKELRVLPKDSVMARYVVEFRNVRINCGLK